MDAVFSNAVFHWIPDHDALFRRIFDVLEPGGRLVAQCGGAGNVARFHSVLHDVAAEAPFAEHIGGWDGPWNFQPAPATAIRLGEVGFEDVSTWTEDWPVVPDEPEEFIRTVCLGHHLERLPEELRPAARRADGGARAEPADARLRAAQHGREEARMRILTLPGDGIGPEIMAAAEELLARVGEFELDERLIGGASIDAHGVALTDEVLGACRAADAVLLAAVGGPKWDTTDPGAPRPEQGLLGLRKGLELFANLRPVRPTPALLDASPLRRERIEGTDLLVVRELTGGIYFGERGREDSRAFDTCVYSVGEIERIAEVAFKFARRKVTSVDKANVLETSRLWREVVSRVAAGHAETQLEHLLVDNAAMQLVSRPADFDVILTENMFGDILSDEAAMLTGSIGMLPSASVGAGGPGLFEPVHGSAPDIAGTGRANPLAMFGSVAMMLRYGFGMEPEAAGIESAIDIALEAGLRTQDLGGDATTEDATRAVLANL